MSAALDAVAIRFATALFLESELPDIKRASHTRAYTAVGEHEQTQNHSNKQLKWISTTHGQMLPEHDEAAEVRVSTDGEHRLQGDSVIFVPFSENFQLDLHIREISWYYPVNMGRWFTLP